MNWSQEDAVPFARSLGPPCITRYLLDLPVSLQENQAHLTVSSLSPQLLPGAILPVWSTLTFSRNLFRLCYSLPCSLESVLVSCVCSRWVCPYFFSSWCLNSLKTVAMSNISFSIPYSTSPKPECSSVLLHRTSQCNALLKKKNPNTTKWTVNVSPSPNPSPSLKIIPFKSFIHVFWDVFCVRYWKHSFFLQYRTEAGPGDY